MVKKILFPLLFFIILLAGFLNLHKSADAVLCTVGNVTLDCADGSGCSYSSRLGYYCTGGAGGGDTSGGTNTDTGSGTNTGGDSGPFIPGTDQLPYGYTWVQNTTPCAVGEQYCYQDATGKYQHGVLQTTRDDLINCATGNAVLCGVCCTAPTSCTAVEGGRYECRAPVVVEKPSPTPTGTGSNDATNPNGTKICYRDSDCASNKCDKRFIVFGYCVASAEPSPTPTGTTAKLTCDPVENGKIDDADFELWKKEYTKEVNTTKTACLSPNNKVDLLGFQVWKDIYIYKIKQEF